MSAEAIAQAEKLIPCDIRMFSGCRDEQTSADGASTNKNDAKTFQLSDMSRILVAVAKQSWLFEWIRQKSYDWCLFSVSAFTSNFECSVSLPHIPCAHCLDRGAQRHRDIIQPMIALTVNRFCCSLFSIMLQFPTSLPFSFPIPKDRLVGPLQVPCSKYCTRITRTRQRI